MKHPTINSESILGRATPRHIVNFVGALVVTATLIESAAAQTASARQGVPDGVKAHRDIPYAEGGHERQKLDLYLPDKAEGPLPVIVWVHGGGWQAGSKDLCLPLRQGFAQRGYAIASIGYRLSGDAVFPAQIEDCKAAVRWLRAHAKEYKLDPDRFGAWGSSAGGHLVALLGTSGGVKAFDVGAHPDQSSRVQAVCDFYGPTDFTVFVKTPGYESHARAESPEAKLIGGAVLDNPDKVARLNSISYVSKDDPPFLIVHGDQDSTVPINQSRLLFDALKQNAVSAHFHTIKGAGHGGPGFAGEQVDAMVNEFFERTLRGKTETGAQPVALQTESTASATAGMPQRPFRASPAMPAGRPGIPWRIIAGRDDKNRDGKVTKEEFSGPPPLFDRLDRNRDGVLTEDESEAEPQRETPAAPERASAVTPLNIDPKSQPNIKDSKAFAQESSPLKGRSERERPAVKVARDIPGAEPVPREHKQGFRRTRVIGFSQVAGWFVAAGVFESIVGDDRWELQWNGGGGLNQWRNRDYVGWSRPLVSPCPGDEPPDRVLLSISGPYGSDERAWIEAIEATIANIQEKLPSVRQIILQAVVGGPDAQSCPAPANPRSGSLSGGEKVRASWQHAHIVNAIREVTKKRIGSPIPVIAGYEPKVRRCEDYADALGHFTLDGAAAVGRAIGEYYAAWDGIATLPK